MRVFSFSWAARWIALLLVCATASAQCEDVFPQAGSAAALLGPGSASTVTVIVFDDELSDALCEVSDTARALPVTLLSVKHSTMEVSGSGTSDWPAVALVDGLFLAGCESNDVDAFLLWAGDIASGEVPEPTADNLDCADEPLAVDWDHATRWAAQDWLAVDEYVECLIATGQVAQAAGLVQRAWNSSDWSMIGGFPPATLGLRGAIGRAHWRAIAVAELEGSASDLVRGILEEQLEDIAFVVFAATEVGPHTSGNLGDFALFAELLGRADVLATFARESPLVEQIAGKPMVDDVFDVLTEVEGLEAEAAAMAGSLRAYARSRVTRAMQMAAETGLGSGFTRPELRRTLPGILRVATALEGPAGALDVIRAAAGCGPLAGVEAVLAAQAAGLEPKVLRRAARGVLDRCAGRLTPDQEALLRSVGSPEPPAEP